MRSKNRQQISRINKKDLRLRQRNRVGRSHVAVEHPNLSNGVPCSEKVEHDLLAVRVTIRDLDPTRNDYHHGICAVASSAEEVARRVFSYVPPANECVE